jgi:hypothetical protein
MCSGCCCVCLQHLLQEAKKKNQHIPDNVLNMLKDFQMVSTLDQLQPWGFTHMQWTPKPAKVYCTGFPPAPCRQGPAASLQHPPFATGTASHRPVCNLLTAYCIVC